MYSDALKPSDRAVTDLAGISDRDLIAATNRWRILASEGAPGAARFVREHEDEMTRRFGGATTVRAPLAPSATDDKRAARPWWWF